MVDVLGSIISKCKKHRRKDLLGIADLSKDDILLILDTAEALKKAARNGRMSKFKPLKGKHIITLFTEPSTRTPLSFTIAGRHLGADVIDISPSTSSIVKGETILDTIKNMEAMGADVVVMRHSADGVLAQLAGKTNVSIVNAGDGKNEHPTQALLDAVTIREKKGRLEELNIVIVGDIAYSRVARSNINLLTKFRNNITIVAPPVLMPKYAKNIFKSITISRDFDSVLPKADVVMMLRLQLERQEKGLIPSFEEYTKSFGLGKERLKLLKKDAIIMHPGPVNRGIELSDEVVDCGQSVILDQTANGVYARMAVFLVLSNAN